MSGYTMKATLVDGTVREFAPPIRAVSCELASGRVDIIDGDTGEVLIEHGAWQCVDIPFASLQVDVTRPLLAGDWRKSLTVRV